MGNLNSIKGLNNNLRGLIKFYKFLKMYYEKQGCPTQKPLVAKNAVLDTINLQLFIKTPGLYDRLYTQLYIFYSLFAQNTNDKYTINTVNLIYEELKKRNFLYDLKVYKSFFYKHIDRNYSAFLKILELITIQRYQHPITIDQFLKITGVGYKTSALLYNEFVLEKVYPVVDIHVINGYNTFFRPKTGEQIFKKLVVLTNQCDLYLGYQIASLLYCHRKFYCTRLNCKNKKKTRTKCTGCKKIYTEYKKFLNL